MPYSIKTAQMMDSVEKSGLNIYAMFHMFRKKSKMTREIPEVVVQAVCLEFFKRQEKIQKTFPYFLKVLYEQSRRYCAEQNIKEHAAMKNTPSNLAEIMRKIEEHNAKAKLV